MSTILVSVKTDSLAIKRVWLGDCLTVDWEAWSDSVGSFSSAAELLLCCLSKIDRGSRRYVFQCCKFCVVFFPLGALCNCICRLSQMVLFSLMIKSVDFTESFQPEQHTHNDAGISTFAVGSEKFIVKMRYLESNIHLLLQSLVRRSKLLFDPRFPRALNFRNTGKWKSVEVPISGIS